MMWTDTFIVCMIKLTKKKILIDKGVIKPWEIEQFKFNSFSVFHIFFKWKTLF